MTGPRVLAWPEIEQALAGVDVVAEMAAAFQAYSAGRCVIPPVGELSFDAPRGDVHIKYGYVRGDDDYVVKIASGFYDNPALGLRSSNGLMLLFAQRTGELRAVLLDEGRLTDIRTAAAGAVAARALAPAKVTAIGILGTGIQARLQLEYLRGVVDCERALVFGRNAEHAAGYAAEMTAAGFAVTVAPSAAAVGAACNLIVTTTPAAAPILARADVRPGTHITAVGADTPGKQELDPELLGAADLVVADSRAQCQQRGEIAGALRAGCLEMAAVVELGELLAAPRPRGPGITVADLTGVAVQDVQIASAVVRGLASR